MAPGTGDLTPSDVEEIIAALRAALHRLWGEHLSGAEATRLVEAFAQGERLCAAGKMVAARFVERSGAWRAQGDRSAAHWMAKATGVAVGQAVGSLETARRLEGLPATEQALCSGELSETKVKEVAAAASALPSSEGELLQAARTQTVASLRERCRRVRAQALDEDQAYDRIHRGRYLRCWTEPEGAFRLEARLTADDGARVMAGIEPHRARIFAQARSEGRRESSQAYAADALVALASGESSPRGAIPPAMVHVRVDRSALLRGHAERGEVCEIPGIGPIPVSAARRLCSDAVVKAVLLDGPNVTAAAHLGRSIPARVQSALEARDPTCVVPGCDARVGLEIDHLIPFAQGGPTTLDNLARLCRWHHHQKSHRGYRLSGSPGQWAWTGPDPPAT